MNKFSKIVLLLFVAFTVAWASNNYITGFLKVTRHGIFGDSLRVGKTSIFNGIIDYKGTYCDTNSFVTTAIVDTVVISGLLTSDKVFIGARSQTALADSSGVIYATTKADTMFVAREAGTASGLKYHYLILR